MDWVCVLQPTDPLRAADDIRTAVALAEKGGCDSVISVVQVSAVHPIRMKRIEDDRLLPYSLEEKEGTSRQDLLPPAFMRNGAIYLTRRDVLIERGSLWGEVIRPYVMPEGRSVGIDSELDLKLVQILMDEVSLSG
jgi:CMP-N-acetylneuraminic acid synthetase